MLEPIMKKPIEVFISYHHEDRELVRILIGFLNRLSERNFIEYWYDEKVFRSSESWQQEIEKHLNSSQIILLCLSPDYLSSLVASREMSVALKRHLANEAVVIPIISRSIDLADTPLTQFQVLPTNKTPIENWKDLNAAFEDVMKGIEQVIRREIATYSLLDSVFAVEGESHYYSDSFRSNKRYLDSNAFPDRYIDRLRRNEGYAVARIKDNEDDIFYLGKKYVLQAGMQKNLPKGFKGVGITLDTARKQIVLDIVIYAEDMTVLPKWYQSHTFILDDGSELAEFILIPQTVGAKRIYVEFFDRRHWLAKIQFEILVVETIKQAIS